MIYDVVKIKMDKKSNRRFSKYVGTLVLSEKNGVLYLNMFDEEYKVYPRRERNVVVDEDDND